MKSIEAATQPLPLLDFMKYQRTSKNPPSRFPKGMPERSGEEIFKLLILIIKIASLRF